MTVWRASLAWFSVTAYTALGFVYAVSYLLNLVSPLTGWTWDGNFPA